MGVKDNVKRTATGLSLAAVLLAAGLFGASACDPGGQGAETSTDAFGATSVALLDMPAVFDDALLHTQSGASGEPQGSPATAAVEGTAADSYLL